MDNRTIHIAWPFLKKRVRTLDVPWLEQMVRSSQKRDPFKVLISCLLSLRTQDRTTGGASERLFHRAQNAEEMSRLPLKDIERVIYPVGFYRVKAKRIKALCSLLVEHYNSKVPDSIDELLKLKGVGRKTANLVVTLGYRKRGICVDTHVHRITNRWGYVKTKTPDETEFALRKKLPEQYISPLCSQCSISRFCKKVGVKINR
jgi:endonuclease-3